MSGFEENEYPEMLTLESSTRFDHGENFKLGDYSYIALPTATSSSTSSPSPLESKMMGSQEDPYQFGHENIIPPFHSMPAGGIQLPGFSSTFGEYIDNSRNVVMPGSFQQGFGLGNGAPMLIDDQTPDMMDEDNFENFVSYDEFVGQDYTEDTNMIDQPYSTPLITEPNVCYGTLEQVPIVQNIDDSYITAQYPLESFITLTFFILDNIFSLVLPDGIVYAVLGLDFSMVISGLYDIGLSKISAYMTRNLTLTDDDISVSPAIEVTLMLFGPESLGASVALRLQENNLFLQAPLENDLDDLVDAYVPPEGYEPTQHRNVQVLPKARTQTKVSTNLEKLLPEVWKGARSSFKEKLYCDTELARLKTSLLPHQVEAVSFMRHREIRFKNNIKKEVKIEDLDEDSDDDDDEHQFGGILADEMGLGKSLSTLALIGSTLPKWDQEKQSEPEPSRKTTLLITPTSTLASWKEQINQHIHEKGMRTLYFYGTAAEREASSKTFDNYDLVVTAYSTVSTDWKKGLLHDKKWYRIVLDEAHYVREIKTNRSKAITELRARRKWCLSGTPIQNRISDLAGLFSFLQLEPIVDSDEFKQKIAVPLRKGQTIGLDTLRHTLEVLCLRRTRDTIVLPPRQEIVVKLALPDDERQIYNTCREQSRKVIGTFLKQATATKKKPVGSGSSILQSITRQRQLCDHGLALLPKSVGNNLLERSKQAQQLDDSDDTPLPTFCDRCNAAITATTEDDEKKSSTVFDSCAHTVCSDCLPSKTKDKCPICDEDATEATTTDKKKRTISAKEWLSTVQYTGPSPKVKALLENLRRNKAVSHAEKTTPIKSVVFSFWTRMLYLIQIALKEHDITFVQLDGSLTLAQREDVLQKFAKDPEVTVLLMTIGSGSVGLNLTMASDVHLMEPQWNPMVEAQALDRVHRLGQTRNVTATKYIIQDSFEESILALQQKKVDLAKMSLGGKENTEQMKKRIEDLLEVFK